LDTDTTSPGFTQNIPWLHKSQPYLLCDKI